MRGHIYLWSVLKSPCAAAFGIEESAAGMVSSYMLTAFVSGALAGAVSVHHG